MNFELFLTLAVIFFGIIALLDRLFFSAERAKTSKKIPWLVDAAHSFFPVLLFVLVLRSFVIEPFRIPSGSLEPTLLVGDFVFVNKFIYGLRLPVIHTKIFPGTFPQRGDIIVFRYPQDPHIDYIKRVIGLPGDKISYVDKVVYVNGSPLTQSFEEYTKVEENHEVFRAALKEEAIDHVKHEIYLMTEVPAQNFYNLEVPPENYFVMGDNRDDSKDSRAWGFVPTENLIGKAFFIWLSWDAETHGIRWNRLGKRIH